MASNDDQILKGTNSLLDDNDKTLLSTKKEEEEYQLSKASAPAENDPTDPVGGELNGVIEGGSTKKGKEGKEGEEKTENTAPYAQNTKFEEDEKGENDDPTGYDDDTIVDDGLVFDMNPADAEGHTIIQFDIEAQAQGDDGNTYTVIDQGNGIFELDVSEYEHLNDGEQVELTVWYNSKDEKGASARESVCVVIHGRTDNECPVAHYVFYADDEDAATDGNGGGVVAGDDNDSLDDDFDPASLRFNFKGSDAEDTGGNIEEGVDSAPLTYKIDASTILATKVGMAGEYQISGVINNGDGTFSLNPLDYQDLNEGEEVYVRFQYTAVDTDGCESAPAWAMVKIIGTERLEAFDVCYIEDEDGMNTQTATLYDLYDYDEDGASDYSMDSITQTGGQQFPYTLDMTMNLDGETEIQNPDDFDNLPPDEVVEFTVEYTYTDANGDTQTGTYLVTVTGGQNPGEQTYAYTYVMPDGTHINSTDGESKKWGYWDDDFDAEPGDPNEGDKGWVYINNDEDPGNDNTDVFGSERVEDQDDTLTENELHFAFKAEIPDGMEVEFEAVEILVSKYSQVMGPGPDVDGDGQPDPDKVSVSIQDFGFSLNDIEVLDDGTFKINQSAVEFLDDHEVGYIEFKYKVYEVDSDGNPVVPENSDEAIAKVKIIGCDEPVNNDEPPVVSGVCFIDDEDAATLAVAGDEDDSLVQDADPNVFLFDVKTESGAYDPDGGQVTFSFPNSITATSTGGKTITIQLTEYQDGILQITNPDVLDQLDQDEMITFDFAFWVHDDEGNTADEYGKIKIIGTDDTTNTPPEITFACFEEDEDGDNAVAPNDSSVAGGGLIFDLDANVYDADGDALTYTPDSFDITGTSNLGNSYTISINIAADGTVTVTNPDVLDPMVDGEIVNFDFDFTVTDGINPPVTGPACIKIHGTDDNTNTPPEAECYIVTEHETDDDNNINPALQGVDDAGFTWVDENDSLDNSNGTANHTLDFELKANDPDGNPLTYAIATGQFINSVGLAATIEAIPTSTAVGFWNYVYKFDSDNDGVFDTEIEFHHDPGTDIVVIKQTGSNSVEYLNDNEAVSIDINFFATDTQGAQSNMGTAKIKIIGVSDDNDEPPTITECIIENENDIDNSGQEVIDPNTGAVYEDMDSDITPNTNDDLVFDLEPTNADGTPGQILSFKHWYFDAQGNLTNAMVLADGTLVQGAVTSPQPIGQINIANGIQILTTYHGQNNIAPNNMVVIDPNTMQPTGTQNIEEGDLVLLRAFPEVTNSGSNNPQFTGKLTIAQDDIDFLNANGNNPDEDWFDLNTGFSVIVVDTNTGTTEELSPDKFVIIGNDDGLPPVCSVFFEDEDGVTDHPYIAPFHTDGNDSVTQNDTPCDDSDDVLTFDIMGGSTMPGGGMMSFPNGLTVTATSNMGNTFTVEFEHLGMGVVRVVDSDVLDPMVEGEELQLNLVHTMTYTNSNGQTFTKTGTAEINLIGAGECDDNNPPVIDSVAYCDDEDSIQDTGLTGYEVDGDYVEDTDHAINQNGTELEFYLPDATDPDGDPITYSVKTGTYNDYNGNTVTVTQNSNGTYNYHLENDINGDVRDFTFEITSDDTVLFSTDDFQYLNDDQAEGLVVKVCAVDIHGEESNVGDVSIQIVGEDEEPDNQDPIAKDVSYVEDEDNLEDNSDVPADENDDDTPNIEGDLLFNIPPSPDPDGDPLTYSFVSVDDITIDGQTFTPSVNFDGSNLQFSLDVDEYQGLHYNESVDVVITYLVDDGNGGTDTGTLTVTIHGRDIIAEDDTDMGDAGTVISIDVLDNDEDPDGDPVSVQPGSFANLVIDGQSIPSSQIPNYLSIDPNTGEVLFDATTISVPPGQTIDVTFDYTATDPNGETDTATVNLTVKGDSLPPTLIAKDATENEDEDGIEDNSDVPADENDDITDNIEGDLTFEIPPAVYSGSGTLTYTLTNVNPVTIDGQTFTPTVIWNSSTLSYELDPAEFQGLSYNESVDVVITYSVTDGSITDDGEIHVNIHGRDIIAEDDTASGDEGTVISVDVLGNDEDPDGDPVSVDPNGFSNLVIDGVAIDPADIDDYLSVDPNTGEVLFDATTLDAAPGQSIDVTFDYTATDPNGETDTATVNLSVDDTDGPNGDPNANDVTVQEDEDGDDGFLINNSNETLINGELVFALDASDPDGDPLTYSVSNISQIMINGNGLFPSVTIVDANGNPDPQGGFFKLDTEEFQELELGQQVTFTFDYTVDDGNGGTDTATATVTIHGQDVVAQDDDGIVLEEDSGNILINVLNNDYDTDENVTGDTLHLDPNTSIGQITVKDAQGNVLNVNTTGLLIVVNNQIQVDTSILDVPNGETWTVEAEYTAYDPNSDEEDTALLTFDIEDSNEPPEWNDNTLVDDEDAVIDAPVQGAVDENESNNLVFDLNDAIDDPDGDPLTYTVYSNLVIGHVQDPDDPNTDIPVYADIDVDGNLTITNPDVLDHLNVGENPVFTVPVEVSDGHETVTIDIPVQILGTNDDPTDDDESDSADYGEQPDVNVLDNADDVDNVESNLVSIQDGDPVVTGPNGPVTVPPGTIVLNPDGTVSIDYNGLPPLPMGEQYTIEIDYIVEDPEGGTNDSTVTITIDGMDNPPEVDGEFVEDEDDLDNNATATPDPDGSTSPEETFEFDLDDITIDPEGQPMTYSNVPSSVTSTSNDGKTITVELSLVGNIITITNPDVLDQLAYGDEITFPFDYEASDGVNTASLSSNIKILGVNDDPTDDDETTTVDEGDKVTLNLLDNSDDIDGDDLDICVDELYIDGQLIDPADWEKYLMVDEETGEVCFDSKHISIPNGDPNMLVVINYTVKDPHGGTNTSTTLIDIIPDGDPDEEENGDDNVEIILETDDADAQGETVITSETITNQTFDLDDDTFNTGDGDDTLIGDGDVKLEVTAGDATAHGIAFTGEVAYANTDATIDDITINFGDDTLDGGDGDDLVIGDAENVELIGNQGDMTATHDVDCIDPDVEASANVKITNSDLNFGDDSLVGGHGNDTIIGDVDEISLTYTDGTVTIDGAGASVVDDDDWHSGNEFNFGDDTLEGGDGNDTMTGDVVTIEVDGVALDLNGDLSSAGIFTFGQDTFVFDTTAAGGFGDDTITDFNVGGVDDVLQFNGVATLNDVGYNITSNGNGDAVLEIDGNIDGNHESSITFEGLSETELTDYLSGSGWI